ncbi:MAG TPA: ANTAR domain-containing protein [Nocardioides sp.]|uniref:ANTAR domain-containing protein n=1 Tax=Nocardioides sp. TaxID=35761 RepID=UPI002F426C75
MGESVFSAEIAELQQRLTNIQQSGKGVQLEILLQDLGTAVEELRVADEEVRSQQEEVARLLESEQLLRWRHERMLSALPVPVLTTDNSGQLRSINPAGAALVGVPIAHLLRKPLFALVDESDRAGLRTVLNDAVRRGVTSTRRVRLRLRGHTVDVTASVSPTSQVPGEVTWLLLGQSLPNNPETIESHAPLADALVKLFTLSATWSDPRDVLQHTAYVVSEALGGNVSVSVVLGPPSAPTGVASSSSEAQDLDGWQLASGTGPVHAAYDAGRTIVSADVHRDPRWKPPPVPAFAAGLVSAAALPLGHGDEVEGVLAVYLPNVLEATPELVERAEILAASVSSVLQEMGLRNHLEALGDDMHSALASRSMIEQAKGIVMAAKHCTADEAFQHLVRLSNTSHLKLRDVASQVVQGAGG